MKSSTTTTPELLKQGLELAKACAQSCQDMKAAKTTIIKVSEVSDLTDYFVIATANSTSHLKGVTNNVRKNLMESLKTEPVYQNPDHTSGWMILDYINVMVHVFTEETRSLYDLERLWGDAEVIFEQEDPS